MSDLALCRCVVGVLTLSIAVVSVVLLVYGGVLLYCGMLTGVVNVGIVFACDDVCGVGCVVVIIGMAVNCDPGGVGVGCVGAGIALLCVCCWW